MNNIRITKPNSKILLKKAIEDLNTNIDIDTINEVINLIETNITNNKYRISIDNIRMHITINEDLYNKVTDKVIHYIESIYKDKEWKDMKVMPTPIGYKDSTGINITLITNKPFILRQDNDR